MNKKVLELLSNQEAARSSLALSIVKDAKEALKLLGKEEYLNITPDLSIPKEVVKEVVKEVEVIKEVPYPVEVIKEDTEKIKKLEARIQELQNQLVSKETMYKGLINSLNEKINELQTKPVNSNAKTHKELATNIELPQELVIVKNFDTHIIGSYKGIAFEASKKILATTIYDPTKWNMKDELNELLISKDLINASRDDKDMARVECELGSCHEISPNKFMGYVVVDNTAYSYVNDKNYNNGNGSATIKSLKAYLSNPKGGFSPCTNAKIVAAIEELINRHKANVQKFNEEKSSAIFAMLGLENEPNTVTNDVPVTHNIDTVLTYGDLFNE